MAGLRESPCKSCTRVKNPKDCEMKSCVTWKAWFVDRWAGYNRRAIACGIPITPIVPRAEENK